MTSAAGSIDFAQVASADAIQGSLPPNSGGSFNLYEFTYPGNQSRVSVNLEVDRFHLVPEAVGFNVYGPNGGLVTTGAAQSGKTPNVTADLVSSVAGSYTVQVYNYSQTDTVGYSVWLEGLAASPTAQGQSTEAPQSGGTSQPPPSGPAPDESGTFTGTIEAATGGRFALYEFQYPGDSTNYIIDAHFTPEFLVNQESVGVKVYGPNGNLVSTGEARTGSNPNVRAPVSTNVSGVYTVQLFNYDPVTPVQYTVSLVTP